MAALASSACQQAKGDDVQGTGTTLPAPTDAAPADDDLSQSANDAGSEPSSGESERPVALAPPASDAAVSALPSDPLAIAPSFPIVFRSDRGVEGTYELYVMRADGSEPQRLTRGGDFFLPRWSPDGSRILFRNVPSPGTFAEVGIVSPDGAALTLLTTSEAYDLYDVAAHWSPDGQRILFGSIVPNEGFWVFAMAPSGGQRERLLPDLANFQREATLSPVDPTRIAYIEAGDTPLTNALRVIDADNPGVGLDVSTGRVAVPQTPRWSPDGARIVFTGFALNPDGSIKGFGASDGDAGAVHLPNLELFVLELATGELTQLTDDAFADDYEPAWSPDGSQILFTSARDGDQDLWLMPLADPSQAINLIDDADAPHQDGGGDWYAPPSGAALPPG